MAQYSTNIPLAVEDVKYSFFFFFEISCSTDQKHTEVPRYYLTDLL